MGAVRADGWVLAVAMALGVTLLPARAEALCTWTTTGTVRVKENVTEGVVRYRPLANAHVRVLGSLLKSGGFVIWGYARTDANGTFRYSTRRTCSKRNIRAQVRLDDGALQVANPSGNEWMTVFTTSGHRGSGTISAGTRTFSQGSGGTLGDTRNVRRAITWYAVKHLMAVLKSQNSWLAFDRKIHVRYPANTLGNVSYASGLTMTAYIDVHGSSDAWKMDTLIHEVMHLWNYQHNSGTTNWLDAVLSDGSTHGFQENPNVAFHEGFAAFAKDEVMYHLWGRSKVLPRTRWGFTSAGLTNLDLIEGSDRGVKYALYLLTAEDIYGLRFGTGTSSSRGTVADRVTSPTTCPSSPDLTFWDVLMAFKARPDRGWSHDWQVGNSSYGIYRFYDRISDISNRFSSADRNMYLALLDPEGSIEPTYRCLRLTAVSAR